MAAEEQFSDWLKCSKIFKQLFFSTRPWKTFFGSGSEFFLPKRVPSDHDLKREFELDGEMCLRMERERVCACVKGERKRVCERVSENGEGEKVLNE